MASSQQESLADRGGLTPVVSGPPAEASRSRMGEAFGLLLVTHFIVDCFSSTIATVQPILVERFSLTLAGAGILGGVWMFSSSVMQLPFGLVSDRLQSRHFSIASPLVAAVFLGAMGLATGLTSLTALLLIGGMGVAAYHPYSTSQAGRTLGRRPGFATAIFITAGTAGLGIGPLYLTWIIEQFGFDRLWVSVLPVLAVMPVVLVRLPHPVADRRPKTAGVDWPALRAQRGPLSAHYALVVLRSITQVGLAQYLSLYLVQVRELDLRTAGVFLSAYFLSTSAGSFLGGAAADRFGGKAVIIASALGAGPLLAVFMATEGWISVAAVFVGGIVLLCTVPVNVVMAQSLCPSQAGTLSALMMGFGWGTAGIVFVPALGWLADIVGLDKVLWGFTLLPMLGLPIALCLKTKAQEASA